MNKSLEDVFFTEVKYTKLFKEPQAALFVFFSAAAGTGVVASCLRA